MTDDNLLPFSFPPVERKKVTAAFDGGRLSSDGGVMLLAQAEVDESADDIRTRPALDQKPRVRGFAETRYRAKSWNTEHRACARIEATTKGLDIRFVVTSIEPDRPSISTRPSTAPAATPRI